MLTPPFSWIDDGLSARFTVGVPSSSVMVRRTSSGFDTPPPLAVPDTVTVLLGASTLLSTAVMVTVPVLAVRPAAMVRVVPAWVKSPGTAGLTADDDTVTVTVRLDAPDRLAVTLLTPPASEIEAGLSAKLTVGVLSLSMMVSVTGVTVSPDTAVVSTSVSLFSSTLSSTMVTVPVAVRSPASIVNVDGSL